MKSMKIIIALIVLALLIAGCGKRTLPDEESIKVQLLWPEDDQVIENTSESLDWESFPGAEQYRITVYKSGDDDLIIDAFTTSSYYAIDTELQDGTYRWQVAIIEDGAPKYWSDRITFHLSQIVMNTVPDNHSIINDTRVYFDWLAFPHANGYQIKVWEEGHSESPIFVTEEFTSSVTAYVPFFEGDYCWTVGVRYTGEDEFSRWSDTLNFEVDQYPFYIVDTMHTRGHPQDIFLLGDYMYIADGSAGLMVCNRDDAENPVAVEWFEAANQDDARAIWVDSLTDIMAIADDQGNPPVLWYDVTYRDDPEITSWSGVWVRKSRDVDGVWYRDTLFVALADYDDGAYVYDLHDTSGYANSRGILKPNGSTYGVALAESLLFTAAGQRGVFINKVTDPDSQDVLSWVDTPGEALKIAIQGNYCYVADDVAGLTVIDFSDPENAIVTGRADQLVGKAQDIKVQGDYCYLALGSGGMTIYDISNPGAPVSVQMTDAMYCYSIAIDGDILYIADRDWGIVTLRR